MNENDDLIQSMTYPMVALRGLCLFPGVLLSFDVERSYSIAALNSAVKTDQMIFLSAQKDASVDTPEKDDICRIGMVCRIRQQMHQAQSGICRTFVEGIYRAEALDINTEGKFFTAEVRPLPDIKDKVNSARLEASVRNCLSLFEEYINLNPDMHNE